MKVNELIIQLNKYNPDADISLTTSEDIYLSYIDCEGANKQTTKQVFIEPCDVCYSCLNETGNSCNKFNRGGI